MYSENIKKAILTAFNKNYTFNGKNIVNPKGMILKGGINSSGYSIFSMRVEKVKRISVPIHQFVAYTKYKEKLFNKYVHVRHLDGNKLNNNEINIAIGSASENCLDKPKEIRIKCAINASNHVKKYNHKQIINDRKSGMTYKELMRKYNISSKGTISFIVNKSIDL